MKLYKFIIFNICIFNLNSEQIIVNSIPKTGSHLLTKCLRIITNRLEFVSFDIPKNEIINFFNNDFIFLSHLKYSQKNKRKFQGKDIKKFFIYRDPRDQLISFLFWSETLLNINYYYHKYLSSILNPIFLKATGGNHCIYDNLTFNEKIFELIYRGSSYYDVWGNYKDKNYKTQGIAEFYYSYLPWLKEQDFCIIKFENLIGLHGGGTEITQLNEIKKITKYLNKKLTDQEIKIIAKKIFGGTATFKSGTIGKWKKYFNNNHKIAFKEIAGNLLIELGYESDLNW